jgi:hypothetical protein
MATITETIKQSSIGVKNISKSVFYTKRELSIANRSIDNVAKIIQNKTKARTQLSYQSSLLEARRREFTRRMEIEDQIESSSLKLTPSKTFNISSSYGNGGILSRLFGFLGYMTAGWMVQNIPTWIVMGKEFIARMQRGGEIISKFVGNVGNILKTFGYVLSDLFQKVVSFKFSEIPDTINSSFDLLTNSFESINDQIFDAYKLLTTPLSEGLAGGEEAPPTGQPSEEKFYPQIPVPGQQTAPSRLTGIHKQALDIIAGPESGGNYNAMNQGTDANGRIVGSGDSNKVIGKPLTSMTIGEVMDRQNERKYPRTARPDRGIHAAGKYQIIGNTLPGAVKSAGLTPSDMFSPQNQDLLGLAVLRDKGIGAWTVGGSKYSSRERQIVEQARRTPVSTTTSTSPAPQSKPTAPPPPQPSKNKNGFLTSSELMKVKPLSYPPDYQDWYGGNAMLNPSAGRSFVAAQKAYGKDIPINSAYRSYEHQKRVSGPVKATPGYSKHGLGLAIDLEPNTAPYNWMKQHGPKYGWYYANIPGDPYHFEYRGGITPTENLVSKPISSQSSVLPQPAISSKKTENFKTAYDSITTERKAQQILFIDDRNTKETKVQISQQTKDNNLIKSQISDFALLNNFIKQKLLLDLAYL